MAKKIIKKKKRAVRRKAVKVPRSGQLKPGSTHGKFYYGVKQIEHYKTKDGDYVKSHQRVIAISIKTVALMAAGFLVSRWIKRQVEANVRDIAGLTKNQTKMARTIGNLENQLERQLVILEQVVRSHGFQQYAKSKGYGAITKSEKLAEDIRDLSPGVSVEAMKA